MLTLDNRKPITDLYADILKKLLHIIIAGNYNDALKGFKSSLEIL